MKGILIKGGMDNSSYRLNFDPDKKGEIYHHSLLKLVKLPNLVAKCCKMLQNMENIAL
jgi:hypothetical protein